MLRIIPFLAAILCLPAFLSAQCLWRLDMLDSYGDGWNGGELTITSGTSTQTFTLNNVTDDGIDSTVYFLVNPGVPLEVSWVAGGFLSEVSMEIFDVNGVSVFDAAAPADGVIFTTVGVCPACVKPNDVITDNIYSNRAKIRWTPGVGSSSPIGWWVIYGPEGFVPGPGVGDTLYVTTPKATITGLSSKQKYSYYVIQDCGGGSYGDAAGPYTFETYWANDVAVTALISPQSACDLGAELIQFAMTNLGANPQSLIPYTFFVNGQAGGVTQPEDGYYTGVIGKDSTEVIEFETSFNFSDPGEYEIMVITQMMGDEDTSNDTLRYFINNVLVAPYSQSFESWNGGWTVVNDPDSFTPPSWEYGVPAAEFINAAGDGQKAWVTNLEGFANQGEVSYIQSTCFDFSGQTAKPAIEFLINYSAEEGSNGAFVESSVDGGTTWSRIGDTNTGMNWYNADDPLTGTTTVWAGASNGWIPTHHLVNGVAGQSNVLFRFGFRGSFFPQVEGVGIDQFKVLIPLQKDLAASSISTLGDDNECGLQDDKVRFNIANVGGGSLPSGYMLYYSINGGAPVSATISNNLLLPDENYNHVFTVPFDSRDAISVIKCWAEADGDLNHSNDTLTYTVNHLPRPIPFQENFNAALTIPDGWTVSSSAFVTNAHNNTSNVLAFNLYSFNNTFTYDLPRYGTIGATDSLRFDYRMTNWSLGTVATVLTAGTKMEVQASTDCGATYNTIYTVDAQTHTPTVPMTTRKISLASLAGMNVRFRFVGTWGAGDFWVDLDNIGIIACAADMQLTADVVPVIPGQGNGSATVNVGLGNPPYTYNWSTGATTATATNLAEGTYTVTVHDSNGCTGTLEVGVVVSGTNELPGLNNLSVRPNPTTGLLMLDASFENALDLQLDLINLLGQRVWAAQPGNTTALSEVIDLSAQPAGIYMLRIAADGAVITRKVVKQ